MNSHRPLLEPVETSTLAAVAIVVLGGLLALLFVQLRRRAAKRSAESRRYQLIVDLANEGIWMLDASLRTAFVNHRMAGMLGYTVDEIMGRSPDDFLFEEDKADQAQRMRERRAGASSQYERRWRRKDGQPLWTIVNPRQVADSDGRFQGAFAMITDISERKRAEQEIGRLAAVVSSSRDAIVSASLDGTVETWNEAAQTLFGYTAEEAIGQHVNAVAPAETAEEVLGNMDKVRRGQHVAYDCKRLRRDGTTVDLALLLSPIKNAAGAVTGFSAIYHDISKRVALESMLRQAEKLAAVGQLAAGIAHEINTPVQFVNDSVIFLRDGLDNLLALIGRCQKARRSLAGGEALEKVETEMVRAEEDADLAFLSEHLPKAVERSFEGLGRVASIVRSMKEFAHPDQREMAALDLNRALQATLTVARSEYRYAAAVETDFGALPMVLCHAGEINQVFLNIIVNAAHAIQDVVKDSGQRGLITVRTRQDGDWAEVSIGDTGGGIPQAIRNKVYDPFFTTKEVGKGTGQGLATAWSVVVEKHGGGLRFETTAGTGTTFFIRLPVQNGAGARGETA